MKIEEVKKYLLNLDIVIKKIVFSDSLGGDFSKIILRPVEIKGQKLFQLEKFKSTQVFHSNLSFENAINDIDFKNFKQILVEGEGRTTIFSISKDGFKRKSN